MESKPVNQNVNEVRAGLIYVTSNFTAESCLLGTQCALIGTLTRDTPSATYNKQRKYFKQPSLRVLYDKVQSNVLLY